MAPTDPTTLATDPPATTPPPAAAPAVDLLAEPTFEECIEEWNRYYDDRKAGRISLDGIPKDHHVVYFAGRIIDHGANYMTLSEQAAAKAGVHWARLVIDYPWAS